jgi:hypothetical protein
MAKLFGLHVWKSMREKETPEEYHARKSDMVTVLFFGRLFTFKIPWRR